MRLCGLLLALLFATSAMAEEAAPRHTIYGGAIELLYAQPAKSTNKRFADLWETDFEGAKARSSALSLRGRLDAGNGAGLDGRMFGEFTYQAFDAKRSYPAGNLHLQHHFLGFNFGAGITWFITPMIAPYIEASVLLPIKNEVKLSSRVGSVRYTSDFEDGSAFFLDELDRGFGAGIDLRLDPSWLLILHYDNWQMGSGKAGGFHVGVGYAL